ncbi:MAG: YggT family protein [Myxococcales bacterium]|jgi:YggT family protein
MVGFFILLLNGLQLIVFADVILSWVMPDDTKFPRSFTRRITQPLYAPFHAILSPEKTGGLDLSPIFVLLILRGMQSLILGH